MRDNQEDAFEIIAQSEEDPSGDLLMIVADGMGGHVGGEIASNLAVRIFKEHFISGSNEPKVRDRLLSAIHAANSAIGTQIEGDASLKGMGCTLIGALKHGDRLIWASVGDSHVYLLRTNKMRRLNADHSVYGELLELVRAGKITQQDADNHPRKNALRSAVIGGELPLIDVNACALQHGDVVVIASDGLDSVPAPKLEKLLARSTSNGAREISQALLDAVQAAGHPHQDNTTVVVYRHREQGRSALSPDSKWSVPPKAIGFRAYVRTKGLLIAGLCGLGALVLLVFVLALKPAVQPEPGVSSVPEARSSDQGELREVNISGDNAALTPEAAQIALFPTDASDAENTKGKADATGRGEPPDGETRNTNDARSDFGSEVPASQTISSSEPTEADPDAPPLAQPLD
jgi:PPM family protein phosphatase